MPEMQDCLSRRYQAFDDLIAELSAAMCSGSCGNDCRSSADDISIKLMCEFWNILKEDPQCNLTQAICQRMGLNEKCQAFKSQNLTCFMTGRGSIRRDDTKNESRGASKQSCAEPEEKQSCCSSKTVPQMIPDMSAQSSQSPGCALSLGKVLCDLKEAVSFEQKCNARVNELMAAQKYLQEQIQELEEREIEGTQMLKQADRMWSCMEEAYKKKVTQSIERQNNLLKQMKEIEASHTKWRKHKQDLQFQLGNVNKCHQDMHQKLQEKDSEIKCINMDIENFNKRIEELKTEISAAQKSLDDKKYSINKKVANISAEVEKLKKIVYDEDNFKIQKEKDGTTFIKDAREDLQKMYRVLLHKKIENEDLKAEKDALILDIDLARKSYDQCEETCINREKTVIEEIAKVDSEIAGLEVKCVRCHVYTDSDDTRKFCIDCPKCAEERQCLYKNDHCYSDDAMECVCMSVKQKFMDNVFENMYNVLRGQAKTFSGKAVADAILNCLKKSRNGKLNEETKEILQKFLLNTIKKNLNITIVGGAMKTRCEMNPETYQKLMTCLKRVKLASISKEDKGTVPRKEPCSRWNMTNECNCPKGPTGCMCSKLSPPVPKKSCECASEKKKSTKREELRPEKDSTTCGADAVSRVPNACGVDVSATKPPASNEKHTFGKNMRAAQCVLGPDSLVLSGNSAAASKNTLKIPESSELDYEIDCECGPNTVKPCICLDDLNHLNAKFKSKAKEKNGCFVSQCDNTANNEAEELNEEYQKFVIKEDKNFVLVPPAILKITDLHIYVILVDKEYEKEFRSIIKKEIDTQFNYPLKLSKTASGTAIIELMEKNESRAASNAVLVRSFSGELIILKDKSPNRTNSVQTCCNTKNLCRRESCNDILRIIQSFSIPRKGSIIEQVPVTVNKKSCCDSSLYPNYTSEKASERNTGDLNNNLLHSSKVPTLKSTHRGILIQDAKNTRMKNKKSNISGNIKNLTYKNNLNEYFLNIDSKFGNMSNSKRNFVHRSLTKTHNSSPDSSCDEISRCVCREYQSVTRGIMPKKKSKSSFEGSMCFSKEKEDYKRKLPHIILRPGACQSTQHPWGTVSKDFFEMSRQSEDITIMENGKSSFEISKTGLYYLDHLPPHLPPFLNNFLF